MKKHIIILVLTVLLLLIQSCGIVPNKIESGSNMEDILNKKDSNNLTLELLPDATNMDTSDEFDNSNDDENIFSDEIFEVHLDNYHNISGIFIDYIGRDNFNEWIEQIPKINFDEYGQPIIEDGCSSPKCNIYEFINHFNISKKEFHNIWYYSRAYYLYDYNPDILFSDDKELIEEYYRRDYNEHERMMAVRKSELNFILDLCSLYYDDPIYGETFREIYDLGFNRFSIPELIYEANLPRDSVEEIYERIKTNPYSDGSYDYDFETIYTQKEVIMEAMKSKTPEEINNIVRSVDGVPCSDLTVQDLERELMATKTN